jgi:tRNA pseudouridine38-40 synthase
LENGQVLHVREPLDRAKIAAAAPLFVGRHDFRGFAANRREVVSDTVRVIHRIQVRNCGSLISIDFDGEGFLYKMARMITGTLVEAGLAQTSLDEIRDRLDKNKRANSFSRLVAPAAGLFLIRVRY